jgi:hypothetical protein
LKKFISFFSRKNSKDNFEIDNLQDNFHEQHIIFNSFQNNCEQLNKDNKKLKDKLNKLIDKIQKI